MQSCYKLQTTKLDVLLLHRASHLHEWSGTVWKTLLRLRNEGIIGSLGVSVQTPEELEMALAVEQVEFIQMPFNILDIRWIDSIESIKRVKKDRKLQIHVRSGFLQGLLLSNNFEHWEKAGFDNAEEIINWLQQTADHLNCNSLDYLCIGYILSQKWIDRVTIGMESEAQLQKNLPLFSSRCFNTNLLKELEYTRPKFNIKALDPSTWQA